MRARRWQPVWMIVLVAAGFVLSEMIDRTSVWTADRKLFARLGVRPEPLPKFAAEAAAEGFAAGLRFSPLEDSGVAFVYDNGPDDQFHLAETLGGGVGAIDFDKDDQPDLIFLDGGDPVRWPSNRTSRIHLFRNWNSERFEPVTPASGLTWTGYGHGCAVADVNNDGFDDVLLTGYQQSGLFLNHGDGTFAESEILRLLTGERWCATACWSDLDVDGDLDLYITCYADSSRDLPTPFCESKGVRIHCNPHSYRPVEDVMLENSGDGGFADRSESSGIGNYREYGLGVVAADLDRDGTPEIFVANDGDRNLLFRRTADWVYEEIALASGVAFNGQGETMGSMGVACADFDRNGRLDLFTTNFSNESNALFRQEEELMFVDSTQGTLVDRTSRPSVGWSAIAFDADCDRLTDLFVANGHVTQMPGEDWAQLPTLLRGGEKDFQESRGAGLWFEQHWNARGACRVDLNRDGLDDLVVSLIDSPAALLLNASAEPGRRIQLELVGTSSPRSAEGAIVEVESASGTLVRLLCRNAGYLSSHGGVTTLGLGADSVAGAIRIDWPSGERQEIRNIAAGRKITVIEGHDRIIETRFSGSAE